MAATTVRKTTPTEQRRLLDDLLAGLQSDIHKAARLRNITRHLDAGDDLNIAVFNHTCVLADRLAERYRVASALSAKIDAILRRENAAQAAFCGSGHGGARTSAG
jgi:hypothetical protein